ncbi:MAG: hypothetical protein ACI959_000172 [Limisphaerales bacterium]|jgi:hypothetical protein
MASKINVRQLVFLIVLVSAYFGKIYLDKQGYAQSENIQVRLASKPLSITKHGRCRMECREIDISEITAILKSGKVNPTKSEPNDSPCPSWAIEGITADGQSVRIVFAECDTETRVITAIDLENTYDCYCP